MDNLFEWTHHGQPAPMHPNYVQELEALLTGRPLPRLATGVLVRITQPGEFHGQVGTIIARGRSRYRVRVAAGILSVVFAGVELT